MPISPSSRTRPSGTHDWYDSIQTVVDWPVVSSSLALEISLAHWDGYSGNLNNIRLYHEPTVDRWYYTPWSTDLAFGSTRGRRGQSVLRQTT